MALGLESVVFQQDLLGCGWKDLQPLGGDGVLRSHGYVGFGKEDYDGAENFGKNMGQVFAANCEYSPNSTTTNHASFPENNYTTPDEGLVHSGGSYPMDPPAATRGRRKRRRTKIVKNSEEMENQRMTHITLERNRRKQMNEYLALLRSMMPSSYIQRGDQASIVGGTINFVKELEQHLQCLEAEKQTQQATDSTQYVFSTFIPSAQNTGDSSSNQYSSSVTDNRSATVNVAVTMMESYANIKIMAENRPKQLLKAVVELHSLHLLVLHINVTTVRQMVLYCFCVKVEDDCKVGTVNEITAAVYEMFGRIHGKFE